MRIMVTGAAGQLGVALTAELAGRGHEVIGVDKGDFDIADTSATLDAITAAAPDAVIHCAAWTAVDAAEECREIVMKINGQGTENVAIGCKAAKAKMIYISTDYVFDGSGTSPRDPDERDFRPLGAYGASKLMGELAVERLLEKYFIVRIAWVFGPGGNNFVKTMLSLAKTHETVRVVRDQIGTPTYTRDLAVLLADMAESEKYGHYHATNEGGFISWYDFARAIFEEAGLEVNVLPISTAQYGAKALRPLNSRLDKSKLVASGFRPLPHWRDALKRFLMEIDENGTN